MNRNVEGLLREMIRLKEILERMPNAFHSISRNPNSGENFVSAMEWVRWGKFSAPLSKRCPAASGLQFPPYLVMDAFLGRKKYDSFLGNEGLHLRAWLPSNLRAFIAAVEYHYRVPEFVAQSGDPRLMGVMDGIIEAYTGERGFMGVHRYKVFGLREGTREIRFAFYGDSYRVAIAKGASWRHCVANFEWDWDLDDNVPWWARDWCAERDYMWLSRETFSARRGPLVPEPSWYRTVDPESFGLTADRESLGVTWCWTKSCPNYYRCFELRRGRRVYIPCEEGCRRRSRV